MRKLFRLLFVVLFVSTFIPLSAQQQGEVKNIILMIPDGTSVNVLSIARWYQQYVEQDEVRLAVDPYICGLVRSSSSDTPIGDSAPTMSCYVTGQLTQTSFLSMYPLKTEHDLFTIEEQKAYQPMATLMEAVKYFHQKSTGLVFTSEFPHATPAACASHWYKRSNYSIIAKQMVYNNIDVVIGGGVSYLQPEYQAYLKANDYAIFLDDIKGFRNNNNAKMWALFAPQDMPYELERPIDKVPSLAEMTLKSIQLLSKNENGFFLMVEGSKIDWAAHDNDAKAAITDYLAFDKAVQAAIDFAKRDGNTMVVVVPDHATGGINLGNRNSNKGYDKLSLDTIMNTFVNYSLSTYAMADLVREKDTSELNVLFDQYYRITLTEKEKMSLCRTKDYTASPLLEKDRNSRLPLQYAISKLLNERTFFGFTTYGHTGENPFLAIYHPQPERRITGMVTNVELNTYLCKQLGLEDKLPELTNEIYIPHQELFSHLKNSKITIDSLAQNQCILSVKNKKNILQLESYTNYYVLNGERKNLPSVIVYVDKNKTFYLPAKMKEAIIW